MTRRIESRPISDQVRKGSYAYFFLLYGSSPPTHLVANLLTVAHSLKSSAYSVNILVTPDIPNSLKKLIGESGLFEDAVVVEYIMGVDALFKKDWFREVFTKLHIFNLVQFERVIFLDLDMVIRDVSDMDDLFKLPIDYAAMENSKSWGSGANILDHGQLMGRKCDLINAGLIFCKPDPQLFDILLSDVTTDSDEHVPGMTPEQFYLARVMAKHLHHISQRFNFEVQLHGGVPLTDRWKRFAFEDVVCFHFSGGFPLTRITELDNPEWGCQTEKRMISDKWYKEMSESVRKLANERGRLAFGLWAKQFALACRFVRNSMNVDSLEERLLLNLVKYGHQDAVTSIPETLVGDVVEEKIVVRIESTRLLLVDPESLELSWHVAKRVPTRPPPRLPS